MAAPSEIADPASAEPAPRRVWRPSLSTTLAAAIGGLVLVTVVLVLGISWSAGRRNTLDLLADKADLAIGLLEARLRDHLDPAVAQASFLAMLIANGQVDPADRAGMLQLLTGAVAATPQVLALLYVDVDHRVTGVRRTPAGTVAIDATAGLAADESVTRALREAATAPAPYWGPVGFDSQRQLSFLNLHAPASRDGELVGLLVAIVPVRNLSRFANEQAGTLAQNVFVLYGPDRVLAHRRLAHGFPGLSEAEPLPRLDQVNDPVLAGLWVDRRNEDLRSAVFQEIGGRSVVVGDRSYLVLLRAIDGYADRPLILGSVVPEGMVSQEIERLLVAGVAGLAVLILAVLAGVVVGRLIARPIRRLAVQAGHIGGLELERVRELPDSRFAELNDSARAFNTMLAGLRWFETYVPRSLVKRLIAKGERQTVASIERELTVMFTDIVGFTRAAERLPATEAAAMLNEHFALLAGPVEAEEGTIDKFIGDALMAFWGAPDRQRDHADRACRAALAIIAAVEADNAARRARGQPPIRMRIGIHTGPVIAGNIGAPGRMNYTIVGDPVNTGNRLEQLARELADPDADVTVLVSGATAAALTSRFTLLPQGAHDIRGRTEMVEVYRLVA